MSESNEQTARDSLQLLEIEPGEFDRIAYLRPRIDGNHTMRASLQPSYPPDSEDGSEDDIEADDSPDDDGRPHFTAQYIEDHPIFYLAVLNLGDRQHYTVAADLMRIFDKQIVAVTVMIEVILDGQVDELITDEEAVLLGRWIAHAAYDYAALNLRVVASNNPLIGDLDLPIAPIDPIVISYVSRQKKTSPDETKE